MIYSTVQEHEEPQISHCPALTFYRMPSLLKKYQSETSEWSGTIEMTVSHW